VDRPTRWSYSRLSFYEKCPAGWKYRYIDGLPSPPTPAMVRGTWLHSLCETVLKEPVETPQELSAIAPVLERLKANNAQSEKMWKLDAGWQVAIDQVWVKAIVDVHFVKDDALHIYDFKSGKSYPSHKQQLELYALIGLALHPEYERAECGAIYIDSGKIGHKLTITRQEADAARPAWTERALKMFGDDELKATPGSACYWCAYKSKVGGPCNEWRATR
jgi:RecB family exonuclease